MYYEKLGFLAIDRKDYQEAINIFKRAFENKKTAQAFLGFGLSNYYLEDYPTARWAFYKALELEPKNDEIMKNINLVEEEIEKIKIQTHHAKFNRQAVFKVEKDYFEKFSNGKWNKFFIKGMNVGLGLPGYFPGEFPIKKGTYLRWFEQIANLGINTIRIYTIHPPSFYEALYKFNESGKKIYLFQGIWVELPENNNFSEKKYASFIKESIRNAIDVVYGNARLDERPGNAHGTYTYDVSPYLVSFIFGREWEMCAVKAFNKRKGKKLKNFRGSFLSINNGTPFEVWITETCNFLQIYEYEQYHASHPLSVVNWPTLDPLYHPSESRYGDELIWQGITANPYECDENEDEESLDVAKIKTEKGGGFFATYHVYPYYPDFMNYDYLEEDNPYLIYLRVLKNHHRNQPVLVAEFGVPSSREVTHWQKNGWHHGGHNETSQGKIDGELMKSIYEAGMAGGILFSWFDEWFKRNWMFFPYEIPAERNPLWFNLQDAEQNYGLLAMYPGYPGRKINLAGSKEEWTDAVTLYKKEGNLMAYKFNNGFDNARAFNRLLVQHDEGFLYILIETKGRIDFTEANYIIGLDTRTSESGEFLFPFNTKLKSPTGLKFLIHLAGREKSRILICQPYDKYLNRETREIKPGMSDEGQWVIMQNLSNARRMSKDGKRFYSPRVFSMSNLRFGSLDSKNDFYNSLADFFFIDNTIEMRIPWGLINFTDPSSKTVLWFDKRGKTRRTYGIKIITVSYRPELNQLYAQSTGLTCNITDSLPEKLAPENIRKYTWDNWDVPIYHTYLKSSYYQYRQILKDF